MKALTIASFSSTPKIINDYPIPKTDSKYDTLIKILAAPIENLDKSVASGEHYSSKYWHPSFPSIPGASAIGKRIDTGNFVYVPAMSMRPRNGGMAEYTVAQSKKCLLNYLQLLILKWQLLLFHLL
ncbi:hypothetical protein [Liquorilactobacillus oeni]|uniref:Nadph quinone reductase or zn-dependent oxidoreductase n=1 Tax=Liquorilactobacillus oeni DSM 19972 TaxID=1423777 RepID=A0A0R1MIQ5_9LACO|nr:hypothetical protein [Liquorilactobacillus oeni]KRL05170.1 nadph quinone reductase or zn-dependent oxidoreductase [Liquorilactobacillus oeni DSM 19972]